MITRHACWLLCISPNNFSTHVHTYRFIFHTTVSSLPNEKLWSIGKKIDISIYISVPLRVRVFVMFSNYIDEFDLKVTFECMPSVNNAHCAQYKQYILINNTLDLVDKEWKTTTESKKIIIILFLLYSIRLMCKIYALNVLKFHLEEVKLTKYRRIDWTAQNNS